MCFKILHLKNRIVFHNLFIMCPYPGPTGVKSYISSFFKHWLESGSSSFTNCMSFFFSCFLQRKHSETQTGNQWTRILQISHWHWETIYHAKSKEKRGHKDTPQWIRESVISLLPADSCCFQGLSLEIISV